MVWEPGALVDDERYAIEREDAAAVLAERCRTELDASGVAILPGFVRAGAVAAMVEEADRHAPHAHHQDVSGTPYLEIPEPGWPEGHPRLAEGRSSLTAVAYDELPSDSPLRALYEWDGLMAFLARALGRDRLYRYDDALGALNIASMSDGDELWWHFDQTDFVVSVALQTSEAGGEFECVSLIRDPDDERYDDVRAVVTAEDRTRVTTVPMDPGTLMLFEGRRSIHRVTPVRGSRPRYVALLGYDTKPRTCGSELLRLVRYGRAEARKAPPVEARTTPPVGA